MAKTKISEFSATPGNNTDIDGINIAEGCAPSGINDAIRELMSQLKDFQTGSAGDSFNGPVGTTTAAAGAFTTLSASGAFSLSGDQVQVTEGGTGSNTASGARSNLSAVGYTATTGSAVLPSGTTAQRDGSPVNGYIRYNSDTSKVEAYVANNWGSVGGGATGAGGNEIFFENGQTVTSSYTITSGKNAGTFGPVSINSGVTVTVPTGSVWTIV